MKNIYLIGMPGCGKSTLGKRVANSLKMSFIDADDYIVEKSGKTIDEIFAESGNEGFRKIESQCLLDISKMENVIVATGGGIVTIPENIPVMKDTGCIIFIDTPVENILNNSSLSGRPLLKDKSKIYDLYNDRIGKYKSSADYVCENAGMLNVAEGNLMDICRKIIKICNNQK